MTKLACFPTLTVIINYSKNIQTIPLGELGHNSIIFVMIRIPILATCFKNTIGTFVIPHWSILFLVLFFSVDHDKISHCKFLKKFSPQNSQFAKITRSNMDPMFC